MPDQHGGLKWGDKVVSKNNLELDFLNKPLLNWVQVRAFGPSKWLPKRGTRANKIQQVVFQGSVQMVLFKIS